MAHTNDTVLLALGTEAEEEIIDQAGPIDEEVIDENLQVQDEEQVEPGSDEEGVEEVDDDFQVEVPVGDEYVTLGSNDLRDAVDKWKKYEQLEAQARQMEQYIRQNTALQQFVTSDPLTSAVAQMRLRNVPEHEIIAQLMQLVPPQQPEEDEPIVDAELERYIQRRLAKEREQFAPIAQKVAGMEAESARRETIAHNNQVFDKAVQTLGIDFKPTPDAHSKLRNAISELYPDIDISTARFTEAQARAIMAQAGFPRRVGKAAAQAATVQRAAKAPRVLSGAKTTGGRPANQKRQREWATGREREEAYSKFGL